MDFRASYKKKRKRKRVSLDVYISKDHTRCYYKQSPKF